MTDLFNCAAHLPMGSHFGSLKIPAKLQGPCSGCLLSRWRSAAAAAAAWRSMANFSNLPPPPLRAEPGQLNSVEKSSSFDGIGACKCPKKSFF
jgi:hypothetical protein